MKIFLVAVDDDLAAAWQRHCGDLPDVTIHHGSIFDLRVDAVVSPANSFGFMDGGIDALYSQRFGWDVQEQLQELIRSRHHGELLVGTAEIVETGVKRPPFLIAAPTMRVPMILRETVNPYLAARAALLLVKHGMVHSGQFIGKPVSEVVTSIAFPGLGTGVGHVCPDVCAHQMRTAIEDVVLNNQPFPQTWADAQERHQRLYSEHVRDLQRDS